jgi:hypothetical protein
MGITEKHTFPLGTELFCLDFEPKTEEDYWEFVSKVTLHGSEMHKIGLESVEF